MANLTKKRGKMTKSIIARLRSREHGDAGTPFRRDDERGSVLILALIFLVVISMTIGALASWTMNDLNNTTAFTSARATHYSASSVTNVAIQSIRYATLLPSNQTQNVATALGECWAPAAGGPPAVSQLTTNNVTVAVWCSTVENLKSAQTRVVDLYACVSTLSGSSSPSTVTATATACQSAPLLHVQVTFDDYPPGGGSLLVSQCSTWCGEGITLDTWSWA
jgi:hypothetical protein